MANEIITDKYAIYNDDCIEVMSNIPDESVHLTVYSPPFAGLFKYSSSDRDLSNNDYKGFLDHYEYAIAQIARITKPGRMSAVHCMDVPLGNSGKNTDTILDFPGDIIRLHTKCRDEKCTAPEFDREIGKCGHGWFAHTARHCIWKEPLGVRNRTMAKKLAHATIVEDATLAGVAGADYLLIFRRAGKNTEPVSNPNGIMEYYGDQQVPYDLLRYRGWPGNQIENKYSHWIWRQYASSFWTDVRIDNILPYTENPEEGDEKHIHPLQLDVIRRAIELYSNLGDVVLEPFMGRGSTVYEAIRAGRMAIGIELKSSYFRQAAKNVATAEADERAEPVNFFDLVDAGPAMG